MRRSAVRPVAAAAANPSDPINAVGTSPRRYRAPRWPLVLGPLLAWLAGGTGHAHAEGFFDTLFGAFSSRPAERTQPAPAPAATPPAPVDASRRMERAILGPEPRQDARTYRTLCVRMCDGFYFPVSNAARRSQLGRDIKICDARCGSESRLFFHASNVGTDAADMTDVMGHRYRELPNAFRYRKALVPGCACKPAPWALSERRRHAAYAAAQQAADPSQSGPAEPAAAPAQATPVAAAQPKLEDQLPQSVGLAELPVAVAGATLDEPRATGADPFAIGAPVAAPAAAPATAPAAMPGARPRATTSRSRPTTRPATRTVRMHEPAPARRPATAQTAAMRWPGD